MPFVSTRVLKFAAALLAAVTLFFGAMYILMLFIFSHEEEEARLLSAVALQTGEVGLYEQVLWDGAIWYVVSFEKRAPSRLESPLGNLETEGDILFEAVENHEAIYPVSLKKSAHGAIEFCDAKKCITISSNRRP